MRRVLVLSLYFLVFSLAKAQKFQIVSKHNKDSVVWYIKNLNTDSIKLGSASLDFYYQTPNLMIWPYWYFGGNRYVQRTGKFCGEKYCWKYKTEIGLGLDAWVQPGDSFPIISGDNYAAKDFDTLMMANFQLYWVDTSRISHRTLVTPPGTTCVYEPIFLSAWDLPDKGIRRGSQVNFQMHEGSKNYLFGSNVVIAILFDGFSLKPYWVSSVFPQNPAGRMIKDFGYPIDSQVFYQFKLANGFGKKTGTLDSIIDGMNSGDYIAMVSYNTFNIDTGNFKTVFAKIGVDVKSLVGGGNCFTMLGRKDLPVGKAQVRLNSNPYVGVTMKIPIIKQQPLNECFDYASCYEKFVFKLSPYQFKEPPKSALKHIPYELIVYPNPSQSGIWQIQLSNSSARIEVLNMLGQILYQQNISNRVGVYELNSEEFQQEISNGIYQVRIFNSQNEVISFGKILK